MLSFLIDWISSDLRLFDPTFYTSACSFYRSHHKRIMIKNLLSGLLSIAPAQKAFGWWHIVWLMLSMTLHVYLQDYNSSLSDIQHSLHEQYDFL